MKQRAGVTVGSKELDARGGGGGKLRSCGAGRFPAMYDWKREEERGSLFAVRGIRGLRMRQVKCREQSHV